MEAHTALTRATSGHKHPKPSLPVSRPLHLAPPRSRLVHLECGVHNLIDDSGLGAELQLVMLHASHQLQEVEQGLQLPGEGAKLGHLSPQSASAPLNPRTHSTLCLHFQPRPALFCVGPPWCISFSTYTLQLHLLPGPWRVRRIVYLPTTCPCIRPTYPTLTHAPTQPPTGTLAGLSIH